MCVCVRSYVCVYMYVCVVCLFERIVNLYVYAFVCVFDCEDVFVIVCVSVDVFDRAYVCVHVYVHIFVCVWLPVCSCPYIAYVCLYVLCMLLC